MSWLRTLVVVCCGLAFVGIGGILAVVGQPDGPRSALATVGTAVVALAALVMLVWKLWGRLDASGDTPPVPWAADDSFANPAPERSPGDHPLSSDDLAAVVDEAGTRARLEGTVEDGLAVVRPALRETVTDALGQRGDTPDDVEEILATGEWTDDPVAASVLADDVRGPDRSLRERVRAWLFPERVVRDRTQRAMHAVAEVADEAVPTVPGQTAPRSVPTVRPTLEDLTRGANGNLQRAADPAATARGPQPATATLEGDDETDEETAGDPDDAADADRTESSTGDTPDAAEYTPDATGRSEENTSDATDRPDGTTIESVAVGRQTRFRGAVAATMLLVAAGLVDGNGVLLLGAIVPLAYVAYGSLSNVTAPDDLAVCRTVSPSTAPPGQPVTVTLTVRNEGERTLADVRIVDSVPDDLAVLEGSPRTGTTLEPGETVRLEYLVVARRGEYDFEGVQLRCRGLGAGAVATAALSPAGDRSLYCRLDADAPPLEDAGRERIGQLTTDRPGEGLSFHSTREYRPDDPADRIDWRQYAKRGTLATVSYERQVAASVVLVVDAREPNRVVAGPGQPTAVDLSAYAATRSLTDLLSHGHEVGIAVLGVDGDGPSDLAWLEPGRGREHRSRALEVLRTATTFDAGEPNRNDRESTAQSLQTSNWQSSGQRTRDGQRTTPTNEAGRVSTPATPDPTRADRGPTQDKHRSDRVDHKPTRDDHHPTRENNEPTRDGRQPGRTDRGSPGSLSNGRPLRDGDRTRSQCRKLIELVAGESQLALFSGLLDDRPLETIQTWRNAGIPVVALSPDVVSANTVSGQYAQTRRRTRLARCQTAGARTVDWRRGTPLSLVVAYAFRVDAVHSSSRSPTGGEIGGEP